MRILHNQLDGYLDEIAAFKEDGGTPVVRWMVMNVPSDNSAGVNEVVLDSTFLLDGFLCELVLECGISDQYVSPGTDRANEIRDELTSWCYENEVSLRPGRYEDG